MAHQGPVFFLPCPKSPLSSEQTARKWSFLAKPPEGWRGRGRSIKRNREWCVCVCVCVCARARARMCVFVWAGGHRVYVALRGRVFMLGRRRLRMINMLCCIVFPSLQKLALSFCESVWFDLPRADYFRCHVSSFVCLFCCLATHRFVKSFPCPLVYLPVNPFL